ncbi:MAG: VOC family protein [Deltaproteobacteria bacterium]|nr:VOC family protein [Deltaproteobacteria bacterium]
MRLGYTLLYVDDVEKTMAFYSKAFGLEAGFLHESKDYGEMKTGDTKLGFVNHATAGSHGFEYEKLSLKSKAPGFEIGFVADNVENAFEHAVNAGAVSVSKPTQKPWGQTVSYVRDCNGLLVEICSAM